MILRRRIDRRDRIQVLAFERSKADVERQRDVIRERRIEHVDGGLLVLKEAGNFLRCERPRTVVEVVIDRDLMNSPGRFAKVGSIALVIH
jgi:hypothetical protein